MQQVSQWIKKSSQIAFRDGCLSLSHTHRQKKRKKKKRERERLKEREKEKWSSFKCFKNSPGKPNDFYAIVIFTFYSNFLKIVLNSDFQGLGLLKITVCMAIS